MKSYSERTVFTPEALEYWRRATELVGHIEEHLDDQGNEIRCHELARALGAVLKLQVVDGQSVGVDHSWLVIDRHTLLDPYAPARMPMVQLVDVGLPTLARFYYLHDGKFHDKREDIRGDVVFRLISKMVPNLEAARVEFNAAWRAMTGDPPDCICPPLECSWDRAGVFEKRALDPKCPHHGRLL